jgi:endonuclease YncB( thermonuclease family)
MITTLIVCATLTVSDGDTLKCDGQLLRLLGEGTPHVVGIDTPELRTWKCQKERRLAKLAKFRLRQLVAGGKVKIVSLGTDRSGRPLVNVYLPDGREAGKTLLREGFAREWRKGRKVDWCS